jgi:hypothetical protein
VKQIIAEARKGVSESFAENSAKTEAEWLKALKDCEERTLMDNPAKSVGERLSD